MNSVLCHIRQQISELQDSMLGGPEALPRTHLRTVTSLQEEHVPVSWVHPNYQPCTHSLVSWLEGKCYHILEQLQVSKRSMSLCHGYILIISHVLIHWSHG